MFYKFVNSIIKNGSLEIIDYNGKNYHFGRGEPHCSIKLHNKGVRNKILLNPELYVGESYVDQELTIEKGTLEDFVEIITSNSYNVDHSFFHLMINKISSYLRFFHQFLKIHKIFAFNHSYRYIF